MTKKMWEDAILGKGVEAGEVMAGQAEIDTEMETAEEVEPGTGADAEAEAEAEAGT